eukprot:CAMPEP_0114628168 /NCGR_PEP_ID=MMETSP0168-20121206/12675_1 /TAXON_ID=95228 ORGANISM="Vannella sp., Strain DIVA3 517/6/12" /NCGR_SAMPLE_ID=MMETSP0168 /ASSEMBLY_ACC=CAM_ASM_000044 /LENGTH=242 /DNA_ID=CAMNT_0001839529 /DNA_START=1 /DNA_END=725 /DNA_ORIENTATION=+
MDTTGVAAHLVVAVERNVGRKRSYYERAGEGGEGGEIYHCNGMEHTQLLKRKRVLSQQEVDQLGCVTERVLRWMTENPAHLPKSTTALLNVLRELCQYSVQVDETVVFFHLVMNQVLQMGVDGRYKGNPAINIDTLGIDSLTGFVTIADYAGGNSPMAVSNFSEEFSAALLKCCRWVCTTKALPRTQEGMMRSLRQLCHTRRSVAPATVLRVLLNNHFIDVSTSPGQSIEYNLPQLPYRHFA